MYPQKTKHKNNNNKNKQQQTNNNKMKIHQIYISFFILACYSGRVLVVL